MSNTHFANIGPSFADVSFKVRRMFEYDCDCVLVCPREPRLAMKRVTVQVSDITCCIAGFVSPMHTKAQNTFCKYRAKFCECVIQGAARV